MTKEKRHILRGASNVINFERDADFYYRVAENRLDSGNLLGALSMYYRALKLRPGDVSIMLDIAALLSDMGCHEASVDMLIPLLSDGSSTEPYCHALYMLGHNYWGMNMPLAARDCFTAVLDTYGDNLPEEQLEAILDAIVTIETSDPYAQSPLHLYNAAEHVEEHVCTKAQRLFARGKMNEARDILLPFQEKYPESIRLRNGLALAFLCNHEHKRCAELIEKNDYSKDVQAICLHMLSSKALNDTNAIDADCDMLKRLNPDDIDGCMRASAVFMDVGRRLDAVPFARKAYELMPYEKNVIHRLAYTLYECGEYSEACSLWERIVKINPNDYIAKYFCSASRKTLNDGKLYPVCIEYEFPSSISIERIQYIANMYRDMPDDLSRLWEDNDEYLCDTLIWAASADFSPLSRSLMYLIASLGTKRAEYFFRKQLFSPYADSEAKETALMLLVRMGVRPPYLLCSGGRMIESNVKITNYDNFRVPKAYREIWRHIEEKITGDDRSSLINAAQTIYTQLIMNLVDSEFPSMSAGQSLAAACAIEHLARNACGRDMPQDDLIEKYGITLRRFKNALDRIDQTIRPTLRKTDGDNNK